MRGSTHGGSGVAGLRSEPGAIMSNHNKASEFVINEATTTWRNIYEQNWTLDFSGNDSELQRATTVNNKSLHQQFTDLEAEIDYTTLRNIAHAPGTNVSMFNDMNFTEQLASLDCITGDPLKLPSQNFDVRVIDDLPNFTLEVPPQFDQSAVDGLGKTIVFGTEDSVSNLPIPAPELGTKLSDMSMTQAIPAYDHAKHRTIVFDKYDDLADMSVTQAIPQKARAEGTIPTDKKHSNKPPSQDIKSKSRTTVLNKNGNKADFLADLPITRGIPQKEIEELLENISAITLDDTLENAEPQSHTTIATDRRRMTYTIDVPITNLDILCKVGPDAMLDDESECDGGNIIGTSSGSEVSLDDSLQEITDVPKSNDIITMIDQMPFMGTWCCEWECAAADEWSFLLMHKRVRLRVKLVHCSENGLGAGVIPHTPVESVLVDSLLGETEHAVAELTVRACVEALRAESATAGCDSVESVVALLPRCAGISRVAMKWGRAMQTARMHLAYALAPDGQVRLKVANVPLRSVWEVTLRVCLGAHPGSPGDEWPRAVDVRAALLEPDAAPEELAELLEAVPRGWGHVPNTIWKVFKYFKHKTKEDDWMQALMR